jgi:hypothetical protein
MRGCCCDTAHSIYLLILWENRRHSVEFLGLDKTIATDGLSGSCQRRPRRDRHVRPVVRLHDYPDRLLAILVAPLSPLLGGRGFD